MAGRTYMMRFGKSRIVKAILDLFVLLAALPLVSCAGSSNQIIPVPEPGWIVKYLPYVESVMLPGTIKADEAFNVTAKLSAVLEPEILRGLDPNKHKPAIIRLPSGKPAIGINLWIFKWDILSEGASVAELVFEVPPLNDGDYILQITSADSREWGGLEIAHSFYSGYADHPNAKHISMFEYPFTVLPPDDVGGGGA